MANGTADTDAGQKYQVSYTYENPSPGGPFKGRRVLDYKPQRGDAVQGTFGRAIVKSVRKVAA